MGKVDKIKILDGLLERTNKPQYRGDYTYKKVIDDLFTFIRSFYNDATLLNFDQIFKTYSPETKRKVL